MDLDKLKSSESITIARIEFSNVHTHLSNPHIK